MALDCGIDNASKQRAVDEIGINEGSRPPALQFSSAYAIYTPAPSSCRRRRLRANNASALIGATSTLVSLTTSEMRPYYHR